MVCRAWVGGVLSVVSASCWSLSLGQFAGQVVMGRTLDVSIPLAFAPDESSTDVCPVVRVYFAEDILPSGQVRVTTGTPGAKGGTVLHVSTLAVLTEPYVRIDAVAGCTNQFSRQYTILADLPSLETPKVVKTVPAGELPVAHALPTLASKVPSPGAALPGGVRGGTDTAGQPVVNKLVRSVKASAQPHAAKSAQVAPRTMAELPATQGSRLKLDPVELVASLSQLSPALKMESDGMAVSDAAASPELEQRRAAARALWRTMNEAPEQLISNSVKADTAGAESQSLKAQLAVSKKSEADLQVALEAERDGIYSHPLVLSLGGGLLGALGGLAVVLRRRRDPTEGKQPWWKRAVTQTVDTKEPAKPKVKTKGKLTRLAEAFENWKQSRKKLSEVDTFFPSDSFFKGGAVRRHVHPKNSDRGLTSIGGPEFTASTLMGGSRSVATEELFDLQQQVEFFISLGQAEEAVDVLVNHLSDSQEPSPLAYLDLLRLYHELGRRTEYEGLRKDFNRLFSGSAPGFDDYSQSRRGLERYEAALSRIQSLWPTPAVLDLIECSIFRQSTDHAEEVFDLEAYRELLLLYGIAREIIAPDSMMGNMGGQSIFGFLGDESPTAGPSSTVMQPLVAQTRESRERDDVALLAAVMPLVGDIDNEHRSSESVPEQVDIDLGLDLGLDLDLSDGGLNRLDEPPSVDAGRRVNEDPMSFDLSGSLFGALPEPGELVPAVASGKAASTASRLEDGASLDFSDLDGIDAFTIKKSGS